MMETETHNFPKDKLRQRQILKNERKNFDDKPKKISSKIASKGKPLQKKSVNLNNDKALDEVMLNSRKRKLVNNKLKTKSEASLKSKKSKCKSYSFLESDCEKVGKHHEGENCSKEPKCNPIKKAMFLLNKEKANLSLVQVNGNQNKIEESINTFVSSEEDSFDDDYEYDEFYESYSDDNSLGSDNYFEETDSSSYEESDFSNSENEFTYESGSFADSDPDYALPQNVQEDLVIHKGTAQKRDLVETDNVNFDSDIDDTQIFELKTESITKEIQQPESNAKNENNQREKECPALVSILDKSKFQIDSSESDYSSYEEASDDSSIVEFDINQKYTQLAQVEGRGIDDEQNEGINIGNQIFSVGIINVKNCIPEETSNISNLDIVDSSNGTEVDVPISEHLVIKTTSLDVDENILTYLSICEVTAITDKAGEFVTNTNKDSTNELLWEGATQNTIQPQLSVKEKNVVGINDSILSKSNEIPKNTKEIECSDTESLSPSFAHLQPTPTISQEHPHFRTLFFNAVNSNVVLVLLKDPLYLYGTVCLTILVGNVDIYGYSPPLKEEFEIFSPRGCSSVPVNAISSLQHIEKKEISETLKPLLSCFSSSDLERIERDFESGRDAILLLARNTRRKKLKNMFKKYMNENVFPNMNSIQTDRKHYASEYLLDCVINTKIERVLQVPEEWRNLIFSKVSKVLIAGGKSVGKSTLLRYLLNCQLKHCERVLVVDLDIGQPELFVPQTISCTVLSCPLLGPGFFLNHQPTRAYVVGHSNIVLCAQSYVRAVKKLIDFCYSKQEFLEIPWLINTMGYNKGFGMELMSIICQLIKPTDIVQLQSKRDINNFDDLLYPNVLAKLPRTICEFADEIVLEYRLHVLCSAIAQESRYQRDWEMSAKDLRYATLLSRLTDVLQNNADWLTDCVPLSAIIEKLQLVNMVCNMSERRELIQAFEANVVYLCRKDENNNDPIICLGIGIVRAIDIRKLYLLPAMAYVYLKEVNCLALGEMPLPSSLFTNQGPKVHKMAAFLYNTVDARTSKSVKQIFHRPSQFLTGKHKNLIDD